MSFLTWSSEIEELLEDSALSNPESPSLAFLERKNSLFLLQRTFNGHRQLCIHLFRDIGSISLCLTLAKS